MQDYCNRVLESKKLGSETPAGVGSVRSAVLSSLQLQKVAPRVLVCLGFCLFFRQNLETKCAISL